MGPPVPVEERNVPLAKKTMTLLTSMIPPSILVLSVLGVIYLGIAAPTEAAGIGASAATILALAYRKFSWKVLVDTATETVKLSGMIFLISSLSFAFVGIFIRIGGGDVVSDLLLATPGGAWAIFAIIMFLVFLLGFFIDWLGIVFIMVPIITPIAAKLGFDALWFGMMVCVNLQTSFMTPPFAYAIFIVKGVSPPELNITMSDIIRGVMPFVVLILVGLALCIAFPEIILWLPGKMIK
jgi:tripartite ATP-independent transporter DctM subunit